MNMMRAVVCNSIWVVNNYLCSSGSRQGLLSLGVRLLSVCETASTDLAGQAGCKRLLLRYVFALWESLTRGRCGKAKSEAAKSRRECSGLSCSCMYWKEKIATDVASQGSGKLLKTRILSLGVTFFSMWLLCTGTISGRQEGLYLLSHFLILQLMDKYWGTVRICQVFVEGFSVLVAATSCH